MFKNNIIHKMKNYWTKTEINRNIIADTKSKCLGLISEEIHNAKQRLKHAGKYSAKTSNILEEKIKKGFNKMFSIQTEEMENIKNDIIKLSNKAMETHYQQNDFSPS